MPEEWQEAQQGPLTKRCWLLFHGWRIKARKQVGLHAAKQPPFAINGGVLGRQRAASEPTTRCFPLMLFTAQPLVL